MVRAGEDLAVAFASPRGLAVAEPKRVLILLVEAQRALGSIDFIGVAHLASGRDTAEGQGAHRPVLETAEKVPLVVVHDLLGSLRAGARRMDRLQVGHQALDRADQAQGRIDDVRGQIARRTGRGFAGAPVGRGLGVGQEVLGVLGPQVDDASDLAAFDDLPGQLACRRPDVVEADHGDDARRLRGLGHRLGVLEGLAERLLAEDRLAGRNRGQGDVAMGSLRRGDDHGFDRGVRDNPTPVIGRALEAECGGFRGGAGFGGRADHLADRPQSRIEDGGHGFQGHAMGLAHVAGPYDANPECSHSRPTFCNRLQDFYPTYRITCQVSGATPTRKSTRIPDPDPRRRVAREERVRRWREATRRSL